MACVTQEPRCSRSFPPAPTPKPLPRSGLQVHDRDHPSRPAVEAFIAAVYRARYGAALRAFAPTLVSLHDADGEIVAAAGDRSAADGAQAATSTRAG
ncbi:MAG: thermostable hemolysin [Rubrivivax sp.]|nr:thermostable hemolysin [Rubrivivax sp.]